jgi:hypothetical protein
MKHDIPSAVALVITLAVVVMAHPGCQSAGNGTIPDGVTPEESFQRVIPALMTKWNVPGGAVALARNGSVVLSKAYGLADKTGNVPVTTSSLFRLASLSKPITAAAVLKLHEAGLLDLDARAFDILNDVEPPPGSTVDPRLSSVTVIDLLRHSGGWDRAVSFDPMFRSREIAAALGVPTPADAAAVIRYMMGQPLDFEPGARILFNFGYCSRPDHRDHWAGLRNLRSGYGPDAGRSDGHFLGRSSQPTGPRRVAYHDYAGPLVSRLLEHDLRPSHPADSPSSRGRHGGWLASDADSRFSWSSTAGRSRPISSSRLLWA